VSKDKKPTDPTSREQHLGAWLSTSTDIPMSLGAIGQVKTVELQSVTTTFQTNAAQVAFLAAFPLQIFYFGQRVLMAHFAADVQLFGKPFPEGNVTRFPGMVTGDLRNELPPFLERIQSLLSGTVRPPFPLSGTGLSTKDLETYVDKPTRAAFGTLMSAQLVLAWTTFETLAGDLWEAAINAHPQTLASLRGMKDQAKKGEGRSLTLDALEEHGFDLAHMMGTLLKKKCKFTSLDNIVESYRSAFPQRSPLNDPAFWENQDVKATAAVRNLIVHKAGRVDREFKDDTSSDSRFVDWQLGEEFTLDGERLQNLLKGLFGFAARLIRAVDDWIIANPK